MNDPKDPWGYGAYDLSAAQALTPGYNYIDGYWVQASTPIEKKDSPKCQCGTSITLGRDDHPMHHSSWCPVKTEDNENSK
jgi:hypothetical protein